MQKGSSQRHIKDSKDRGSDLKKNQYRETVSSPEEDNKIPIIRKWTVKWTESAEHVIARVSSAGREVPGGQQGLIRGQRIHQGGRKNSGKTQERGPGRPQASRYEV